METCSATECSVCNEQFDEESRCPRILPCTHCFCSGCIDRLIADNKKHCPFCRKEFQGRSARDFGSNINLLELMKYTAALEKRKLSSHSGNDTSPLNSLDELKREYERNFDKSIACLNEAKDESTHETESAVTMIHDSLEIIRHIEINILGPVHNILLKYNDRVDSLRIRNLLRDKTLETVKNKSTEITSIKEMLVKAPNFTDVGRAIDDADKAKSDIQTLLQKAHDNISKSKDERHIFKKADHATKGKLDLIQEILMSSEMAEMILNANSESCAIPKYFNFHIASEDLKNRKDTVMDQVKNGNVFAIQRLYGIRRSAKITLTNAKLCVHHLSEGPPPRHAYVLDHRDVIKLVDSSSRMVFLELGVKGSTLGRLHISLLPDNNLSSQFFSLCSGENGHSYAKSNILFIKEQGTEEETIILGDFDTNNGMRGDSLMTETKMKKVGEARPWTAGTVKGMCRINEGNVLSALFGIYTRTVPNKTLEPVLGKIVKGLGELKKVISSCTNIEEVQISDCGFILP